MEAADCRAALSTVGQVLNSMDRPSLDYGVFVDQFHRLGAMRKRAGTTCSGQVMRPLSLSVYKLSLVNAKWSTCTRPTCVSGLYDKIQTAITQGRDAVQAAQRTA